MEFPDLGKNCAEPTCNRLDFLPVKCDACKMIFCNDHFQYTSHNCENGFTKDVQVPMCPLCNKPVPSKRGDPPDVAVSDHIDRECKSDPAASKRKAYTNRCTLKGCKQKEVIPFVCKQCRLNYCLKHRHTTDHKCEGFQGSGRAISNAGAAAVTRTQKSVQQSHPVKTNETSNRINPNSIQGSHPVRTNEASNRINPTAIQGSLTEDEALALALQQSIYEAELNGQAPQRSRDIDRQTSRERQRVC